MYYSVAAGVMVVGIVLIVLSPLLGGLLYSLALLPLLESLYEPESLSREPETGAELLALLGVANLAVGFCMLCVRLVAELLGLAGAPGVTYDVGPVGKLWLGTVATGAVAAVAGVFLGGLLSLLFEVERIQIWELTPVNLWLLITLLFEDGMWPGWAIATALDVLAQAGGLLILCAFITLFLRDDARLGWLYRLTDILGWGRMRWGWINRLALAMFAGGLVSMLRFVMPFDDVADAFAYTGIAVLALGVIPQFFADATP